MRIQLRIVVAVLLCVTGLVSCRGSQVTSTRVAEAEARPNPVPARALSAVEIHDIESFTKTIPETTIPEFTRETALSLVALPLACIDKLQEAPKGGGYLYESTAVLRPDFAKTRAFYGCYDWHSAVNSTWTMTKVLKTFPDLPVAKLIREKLNAHLSPEAIKGEIEFFNKDGNQTFERPYGWSWVLRLHSELSGWNDSEAKKWAANLSPLARIFADRSITYYKGLPTPMRIGVHANTAFSLRLMLDYAHKMNEKALETSALTNSKRFFAEDIDCPTAYEPSGSDFFSPCLEEASLMATVLDRSEFATWLDKFMPPVYSRSFSGMTDVVEIREDNNKLDTAMLGSKAHLIGLGVIRAKALNDIADALPASDARVATYRKLANVNARRSLDTMFEADYTGTHWIASFIVDFLVGRDHSPAQVSTAMKMR